MDYIAQFRVMNPHQQPFFKPKARLLYCNFENFHEKSRPKTHSTGSNNLTIVYKYVSKRECFEHSEYLY